MSSQETMLQATTMWELLEARAAASPDVVVLIDQDDREITFGALRDLAERTAAGLHGMGVTAGTRVTWQLPTRIETVALSLALARLGAVQNPIIPIYRDREVGFVVGQTGAEFLCVPGDWNGFDFVAMAERIAAERRASA